LTAAIADEQRKLITIKKQIVRKCFTAKLLLKIKGGYDAALVVCIFTAELVLCRW
jgi:NH3-dependent NAD+ synthetase